MSGRPMIEAIGAAFSSRDLSHRRGESDPDRLGAVAFTRALGAELLRLKTQDDASPTRAVAILAKRMTRKKRSLARGYALRIAGASLYEWLHGQCRTCAGAGHMRSGEGPVKACPSCNATGIRRHTDRDRAKYLRLPDVRVSDATNAMIGDALDFLTQAYREARIVVAGQLDRGGR